MEVAKVFKSGRSQAVRLPKDYRFDCDEVYISKLGHAVMLVPKDKVWETMLEGLNGFSDDFMADGRPDQGEDQEREPFE